MRPHLLGFVFVAACAADARCDPSLSFSHRPVADAAARPPSGARPCATEHCEAIAVSSGTFHTCALVRHADGTEGTYCWGRNRYGELGPTAPRGEAIFRPHFASVLADAVDAASVYTCITGPQGSQVALSCHGFDVRGVTGADADAASTDRPIRATSGGPGTVRAGAMHIVVQTGDTARLFGDDTHGQLGVPLTAGYSVGGVVETTSVVDADAGGTATCLVSAEGEVRCAGLFALAPDVLATYAAPDRSGVLDFGPRFAPVAGLPRATAVSVGASHACAIGDLGEVFCWGSNVAGEAGTATAPDVPGAIPLPDVAFAVSAGGGYDVAIETALAVELRPPGATGAHTCALVGDPAGSSLWCWGRNDRGQLGDGTLRSHARPSRVPLGFVTGVGAGGLHTCAVSDGRVWCWGDNEHGQLGAPPDELPRSDFPIHVDLREAVAE